MLILDVKESFPFTVLQRLRPSRKALMVLSTMARKCYKHEVFCSVEKLSNFKLK